MSEIRELSLRLEGDSLFILMVKMALYIVVSVGFGYIIGLLYSNAKNREIYVEKELKHHKILSDKNATIIKLKNELRSAHRKVDALNQGYNLQSKLLETKEREFKELVEATKDYEHIKSDYSLLKIEHRTLSIQLSNKIKVTDDKDQIITLLEKKIGQISKENA
jgi:seryl-tRNA synthetase